MHNIKEIRKNLTVYQKNFLNRNFDFKINEFKNLDETNRKLITEKEKLEQEKKILSKTKEKSNFERSKKISEKILKFYSNLQWNFINILSSNKGHME